MKYDSTTKVRLNARKLVLLRASKEWTQKEAARKARVSLPTYRSAEGGLELQATSAGKIAKAYKLDLEELCA
jgi:transcriptional regulator with XRE-family HTH domain